MNKYLFLSPEFDDCSIYEGADFYEAIEKFANARRLYLSDISTSDFKAWNVYEKDGSQNWIRLATVADYDA